MDFEISAIGADVQTASAILKMAELLIEPMQREQLLDMRLPSLKRLWHTGFPDEDPVHDHEPIRQLILLNSMNLEFLHVECCESIFDRVVVFKNQTELDVGSVDKDMVKSLPAIRRLTLRYGTTVAVLDRLPAAQMLSLDIRFDFDPAASDNDEDEDDGGEDEKEGPDEFAAVISQMSNLKEVSIYDTGHDSPNGSKYHALSSMFDKLRQLEKVSIITKHARFVHGGSHGDSYVFSLVQHNPNLRDVCLRGIRFTLAAFASLAQLHHLSHITLNLCSESVNVSIRREITLTDNVLTLLRGSSRNVIFKLKLWQKGLEIGQVTREFKLIAKERGTTAERYSDGTFSEFRILDC